MTPDSWTENLTNLRRALLCHEEARLAIRNRIRPFTKPFGQKTPRILRCGKGTVHN